MQNARYHKNEKNSVFLCLNVTTIQQIKNEETPICYMRQSKYCVTVNTLGQVASGALPFENKLTIIWNDQTVDWLNDKPVFNVAARFQFFIKQFLYRQIPYIDIILDSQMNTTPMTA